jgi:hypothetical protein
MRMENNASNCKANDRHTILVVGEKGIFPEIMVEYAVEVAKRLNYQILGLNVVDREENKEPEKLIPLSDAVISRHGVNSGTKFKIKAQSCGINFEYLERAGYAGTSVKKILREIKRIAFVITGSDEIKEIIAENIAIPVFSVLSNNNSIKGGMIMEKVLEKKRLLKKTVALGAVSAGLYTAVFMNARAITDFFARGSWYAALPIATVLIFSFAHGSFASNLWSLLGIEAAGKEMKFKTVEKDVRPAVSQKDTARKRPRARAYVNPFHRM